MSESSLLQGRIGTYKIKGIRPFAFGRITVLFEATDQNGSSVCVKVFRGPPANARGESLTEEFLREISVHQRVRHPNILPILDFGNEEGKEPRLFLVLPFCRGGNLRELMKEKDFLPPAEALPILGQVGSAIDHAHGCGVIHGDIKPENILLSGDRSYVYLTDFGISKYFAIEERISTAVPSMAAGSTAYLSPEQIDEGSQSPRSDIYSFAVVAYELLTGSLPFDVRTGSYRQMQAKVSGNLIDPVVANPAISEGTRVALLQGLKVDRKERPRSAVDFCQMLGGAKEPVRTPPGRVSAFWESLQPMSKVALVTAIITALTAIITAAIAIIPGLMHGK